LQLINSALVVLSSLKLELGLLPRSTQSTRFPLPLPGSLSMLEPCSRLALDFGLDVEAFYDVENPIYELRCCVAIYIVIGSFVLVHPIRQIRTTDQSGSHWPTDTNRVPLGLPNRRSINSYPLNCCESHPPITRF
jgi:hypothetical protein